MSEKILLKTVTLANGETLGYRETGTGNNILLLIHGNMTSSKHWDILMENFPGEHKLIAVDLRGFGISSYHRRITSLKDFSDDVALFFKASGLKQAAVAGWSTGGAVAMQLAADHPEYVRKLILMESVGIKGYPLPKSDESGQPVFGEFLKTYGDITNDPKILKMINAFSERNTAFLKAVWNNLIYTQKQPSAEQYEAYLEDILTQRNLSDVYYALTVFNISDESNGVVPGTAAVKHIKAPTLILQGDRDLLIFEDTALEIKNSIGDHAKLVILKDCGHSPLIDAPEQCIRHIADFIGG